MDRAWRHPIVRQQLQIFGIEAALPGSCRVGSVPGCGLQRWCCPFGGSGGRAPALPGRFAAPAGSPRATPIALPSPLPIRVRQHTVDHQVFKRLPLQADPHIVHPGSIGLQHFSCWCT